MKNAKKIVIFVLLGILLVQSSFFGVVFAAEDTEVTCKTCTIASYEFQTYINFQVEALQILKKAVRIKEDGGDDKPLGLFSAGILSLPANMIKSWAAALKKGTEDLADGAKAAKIGAIMFTSIVGEIASKDGGGGLLILFRNKPFVRERKTLLDLDMSLHDAMWDLGMEGIWEDDISSELMGDIAKLQEKYLKNTGNPLGLFTTFNIKGSIKYKDMVHMLLRLNSMLKTFISMNNSAVSSKVITKGGISLGFNQKLMLDMVDSYACAKGISACSSMWKDFANNTKVRKQISDGFNDSMTTINNANAELWNAMLSFGSSTKDTFGDKEVAEETGLTPKQLSILRTAYGIDTTKLSKEQGIGLEKTIFAITHPGQVISNINLKPLDFYSSKDMTARKSAAKEKAQSKQNAKYLAYLSFSGTATLEAKLKAKEYIIPTRYETGMQSALEATLSSVFMQKQEDAGSFMIYSNLSVTKYFVQIGSYMHNILETSIGTKDSKGMIKYLGDTCESQCTNKGTTNCYSK